MALTQAERQKLHRDKRNNELAALRAEVERLRARVARLTKAKQGEAERLSERARDCGT
jgi:ubiquinone biosynthesis protein UbiJ